MESLNLLSSKNYGQCPAVNPLGDLGKLSQISTGLMFLLSNSFKMSDGFVTNMSVGASSSWYMSLSPFESIMLGLIVLKLMLLRFLNYLPIDVNKLVGRKRRSPLDPKTGKEKERLAETMFTVLRRLDTQDCLLRTLCELQIHSLKGNKLTRETKLTLSALSKSGWKRGEENKKMEGDFIEERPVLSVFEEAVLVGWDSKSPNATECIERYFICPLTKLQIFEHFDKIKHINVL